MLRASELVVKRNGSAVFQPVSFKLDEGQIMVVIGGTGSGKTSLVKALVGMVPYEGSLTLDGRELRSYSPLELAPRIGVALEDPEPFFIAQRAYDEVAFPLENLGRPPESIRPRALEVLRLMGLDPSARIDQLSGGQKHRLALASALAADPRLLVLDNPFAHLDSPTGSEFKSYLAKLRDLGKGVLITSHRKKGLEFADEFIRLRPAEGQAEGRVEGLEAPMGGDGGSVAASLEGVYFAYEPKKYVIKGISTSLREAEVVALVGRNGAGKTTLGKLMAGLLRPSRGSIKVYGKRPGRGLCSYLFQNPDTQFIGKSVLEDVAYSVRARGRKARAFEEAMSYLRYLKLEGYAHEGVYGLSRGIKRLAALASLMALEPKVAVLDEPDIGLDDQYLALLSKAISRLRRAGASTVVITHSLDFAKNIAERILVIKDGVLSYDGPGEAVKEEDL